MWDSNPRDFSILMNEPARAFRTLAKTDLKLVPDRSRDLAVCILPRHLFYGLPRAESVANEGAMDRECSRLSRSNRRKER